MHSDMWVTLDTGYTPVVVENQKYLHADGPTFEISRKGREDEKKLQDSFNIQYDQVLFGNTLFKNLGGGQFEEVSDQAGMETFWPWGIATGDFDNDGYEDVFIPSGMGYPFFYWPNYLMMNKGDGTFINRAKAAGIEPPARGIYQPERIGGKPASRSSRAAAVADFDGDGRLEIVVNNFNDRPYYFKNQFPKRNYIAFRLEGTRSNRDAIGALVRLKIGDEIMVRQVNPAGGYLAQSSKTVHFGLGDRQKVDSVEIRWPRTKPQTIENPAINQVHKIVERSP